MLIQNIIVLAVSYGLSYGMVVVLDTQMKSNSSPRVLYVRALLVALVLYTVYAEFKKYELFELSPSKKTKCCQKGFNGMPIEFNYEGDSTRFENCSENQIEQMFPRKTASYELLEDIYQDDSVEEYCGACSASA